MNGAQTFPQIKAISNSMDIEVNDPNTYYEDDSLLLNQICYEKTEALLQIFEGLQTYLQSQLNNPGQTILKPFEKDRLTFYSKSYYEIDGCGPPPNFDVIQREEMGLSNANMTVPQRSWTKKERHFLEKAVRNFSTTVSLKPLLDAKKECENAIFHQDLSEEDKTIKRTIMDALNMKVHILKTAKNDSLIDKSILDWHDISTSYMDGRRTANACELMWENHINTEINHESWNCEEDHILSNLVNEHSERNWNLVALELNTRRTAYQCFVRYQTTLNTHSMPWSEEEDIHLKTVIDYWSIGSYIQWGYVALCIEGRTAKEIARHWNRGTESKANQGKWTHEEDALLLKAVERFGCSWLKVSDLVSTRDNQQCRSRYMDELSADIRRRPWSPEEDLLLLKLYEQSGPKWAKFIKSFRGKTRNQLLQRYQQILKSNNNKVSYSDLEKRVNEGRIIAPTKYFSKTFTRATRSSKKQEEEFGGIVSSGSLPSLKNDTKDREKIAPVKYDTRKFSRSKRSREKQDEEESEEVESSESLSSWENLTDDEEQISPSKYGTGKLTKPRRLSIIRKTYVEDSEDEHSELISKSLDKPKKMIGDNGIPKQRMRIPELEEKVDSYQQVDQKLEELFSNWVNIFPKVLTKPKQQVLNSDWIEKFSYETALDVIKHVLLFKRKHRPDEESAYSLSQLDDVQLNANSSPEKYIITTEANQQLKDALILNYLSIGIDYSFITLLPPNNITLRAATAFAAFHRVELKKAVNNEYTISTQLFDFLVNNSLTLTCTHYKVESPINFIKSKDKFAENLSDKLCMHCQRVIKMLPYLESLRRRFFSLFYWPMLLLNQKIDNKDVPS